MARPFCLMFSNILVSWPGGDLLGRLTFEASRMIVIP